MKTSVCVIFNHPFPSNIPILRSILKSRFDFVTFVIPNYRSDEDDVITTYRGSYTFQGMIVDAYPKLKEQDADFYFFVQDDVFLNPLYTGEELIDKINLSQGESFLPGFAPLGGDISKWAWSAKVVAQFTKPMELLYGSGAENPLKFMPDAEMLSQKLESVYGIKNIEFTHENRHVFEQRVYDTKDLSIINGCAMEFLSDYLFASQSVNNKIDIGYPFVHGMSDFFVASKDIMNELVHTLGVLSTFLVFAEVAIPTALAACSQKVIFLNDVKMNIEWIWDTSRDSINAAKVIEDFKNNTLLIHPVKLSKDIDILQNVIDALK